MLSARSNTSALNGASSNDEQQLQDLESLAQRIRALETLLTPSTPATTASTSPAAARASGSGFSGVGATSTSSLLSNESEGPTEDTTAGGEDIVSTSASSSPRGGRVGGDPHLVQQHPSRNHHQFHSHELNAAAAGSLSRRIQKIETRLWAAAKERKPTEEFLQKCKFFYLFLLVFRMEVGYYQAYLEDMLVEEGGSFYKRVGREVSDMNMERRKKVAKMEQWNHGGGKICLCIGLTRSRPIECRILKNNTRLTRSSKRIGDSVRIALIEAIGCFTGLLQEKPFGREYVLIAFYFYHRTFHLR